jgi:hypothetical protein
MNQKQILLPLEVHCCPFKHNDLCPRKWSAKFINYERICNCECHNKKTVLGRDENLLPNTINLSSSRSSKEDEL